jgi:hypothetical protein
MCWQPSTFSTKNWHLGHRFHFIASAISCSFVPSLPLASRWYSSQVTPACHGATPHRVQNSHLHTWHSHLALGLGYAPLGATAAAVLVRHHHLGAVRECTSTEILLEAGKKD